MILDIAPVFFFFFLILYVPVHLKSGMGRGADEQFLLLCTYGGLSSRSAQLDKAKSPFSYLLFQYNDVLGFVCIFIQKRTCHNDERVAVTEKGLNAVAYVLFSRLML